MLCIIINIPVDSGLEAFLEHRYKACQGQVTVQLGGRTDDVHVAGGRLQGLDHVQALFALAPQKGEFHEQWLFGCYAYKNII